MLKNYADSSLPARGLLMKIMFKELNEIANNRSLDVEGQGFPFTEQEIPPTMGAIQMDIVAKTMMYIEDLLTLLIAMKDHNGNYYRLLDRTAEQELDLGDRIKEFLGNIGEITFNQWRTMLSYVNPDQFTPQSYAVNKLIRLNIEEY